MHQYSLPLKSIGLSLVLLFVFYKGLLLSPNTSNFGLEGDPIKNYWVIDYHVKHDQEFSRFNGTIYPHGEHVMFTDGQPLIGAILFMLKGTGVSNYVVGIVNWAMVINILLASWLFSILFRKLDVSENISVLFGVYVTFMAPQIYFIEALYSLSYSFLYPLTLILYLNYRKSREFKWTLFLMLLVFAGSWLHLYFLLTIGGFLFVTYFMEGIRKESKWPNVGVNIFLVVVLPLASNMIWLKLTDTVTDRPSNPYGFLTYKTSFENLFLGVEYPITQWWSEHIFPIGKSSSLTYLGGVVVVILIIFLVRKSKKKLVNKWVPNSEFKSAFIAGVLLTVFALGIPFIWGLDGLLEYLGPLKQFRAIGRFSWMFIYLMNVFALVWIFKESQFVNKKLFFVIPLVAFGVYQLSYRNYQIGQTVITNSEIRFNTNEYDFVQKDNYQAILPVPTFWIGAESISLEMISGIYTKSLELASNTGLPIIGNTLSRTSFEYSKNAYCLQYQVDNRKDLLKGYTDKNLLVLTNDSCSKRFPNWAKQISSFKIKEGVTFGSFPVEALEQSGVNEYLLPISSEVIEVDGGKTKLFLDQVKPKGNKLIIKLKLPTSADNWKHIKVGEGKISQHQRLNIADCTDFIKSGYVYLSFDVTNYETVSAYLFSNFVEFNQEKVELYWE